MMRLPAVLFLAVAWLSQTTIKPVPASGIPAPEAGRVAGGACVARLGAATVKLSAKLTASPDDHSPGKTGQAGFFNEAWSLQDR